MKNQLTLFIIFLAVMAELTTSCSKKDTITPPPPPVVLEDTLAAGWTKVKCASTGLQDVFFINNNEGYALAAGAIFRSTNGGNSWDSISNVGTQAASNLFVTPNGKLFVICINGVVFSSTDKGVSFTSQNPAPNETGDAFFTDDTNGYLTIRTGLLYTNDGGITWLNMDLRLNRATSYASLAFIGNTGWLAFDKEIHVVNAASKTAVKAVLPAITGSNAQPSVFAVSSAVVYVAFSSGEILKSTDGGLNFSKVFKLPANYTDIHFTDAQTGYATNSNRVYKTTDGGLTWNVVAAVGNGNLVELHFTDATHGWACGNGIVLKFNG